MAVDSPSGTGSRVGWESRLPHSERLREDLDVLTTCRGLPMGCPDIERALVLQGEEDAIVSLDVHQQLVEDLLNRWPGSRTCVSVIPAHGHALITPGVLDEVLRWLS